MDKIANSMVLVVYVFSSTLICAWFYAAASSGGTMIMFASSQPNKPMGPGQHFHK